MASTVAPTAAVELSPFLAAFRDRYLGDNNARDMWRRITAAGKVSQPAPMDPDSPTYALVPTTATVPPFRRDPVRLLFCNENLQGSHVMRARRWCSASNHMAIRLEVNVNMLRDLVYTAIVDDAYTVYLYRLAGDDMHPKPANDLASYVPVPLRDLQFMTRFWKFSHDEEARPLPENMAAYLANYGRTEHQHRFTLIKDDGNHISACVDIRAVINITRANRRGNNGEEAVAAAIASAELGAGAEDAPVFRALARTEARVLEHQAPHAFADWFGATAHVFRTLDEHAPALAMRAWYGDDATQPLLMVSAVREAVLALDAAGGKLQAALLAGMTRPAAAAIQAALVVSQRPSIALEAAMAASMRDEQLAHMAGKPAAQYAYAMQVLCPPTDLHNALRATLAALRIMAHVTQRKDPLVARRLALYASAVRFAPPRANGEMPLVVVEPGSDTLCWGYVDALPAATLAPPQSSTTKRSRDESSGDGAPSVVVQAVGPFDALPSLPLRPNKRLCTDTSSLRCEPPNATLQFWPMPVPIVERMRKIPGMKRKKEKISVVLTRTHCLSAAIGVGIELFRHDALIVRTRGMQLDLPTTLLQGTLYHRLRRLPPHSAKLPPHEAEAHFNELCGGKEVAAAVVVAILFFALFVIPMTPAMTKETLPPEFHEAVFGKDDTSAALAYARNAPAQLGERPVAVALTDEERDAAPLEHFYATLAAMGEDDDDDDDDDARGRGASDADPKRKRGRPRDERLVLPNANAVAVPYVDVDMVKRLIVDFLPKKRAQWYSVFQKKNAFFLYSNGVRPHVRDVIKFIESFMDEYKRHAAAQIGHGAALTSSLSGVVLWLAFQHVVAACFLLPGQTIPRGPFSLTDFDLL